MTAESLDDLAAVRALVQLYIDGANGDGAKLREAFHPDARMFGNYRAGIRMIDLAADAGIAVLVETDYLGTDFVDYFSVARIDGRWWITNKTYGHAGIAR
jgi:hypothetical protein